MCLVEVSWLIHAPICDQEDLFETDTRVESCRSSDLLSLWLLVLCLLCPVARSSPTPPWYTRLGESGVRLSEDEWEC